MKKLLIISLLFLTACQQAKIQDKAPIANWLLDTETSELSFVSTKNKSISEVNRLTFTNGQINTDFEVQLQLDLNSVETEIPLRNERVKEYLFETNIYPFAEVTAISPKQITLNEVINISFKLSLHGHQKSYTTPVMVQAADQKLIITSYQPVVINAKDFQLDNGVNQLLKLAGLQAISYEVPVDFKLVFHKIDHLKNNTGS